MFKETEIGRIPEQWKVVRLDSVCIGKAEYGAGESAMKYENGLIRYVRITDINADGTLDNDVVGIPPEKATEYILEEGDFLFARSGSVGLSYLYDARDGLCAFAGYLIRFKPRRELLLPTFLKHYCQSAIYWKWVHSTARTTTQSNINATEYSGLPITLPPLPEQRKIAEILSTVDETIEKTDAVIKETQQLKKGLMQKLFAEGIGHTRFRKTILADVEKPIAQRGHQLEQFRILPQDWDIVRCGKVFSLEYGKGLTESERDGGDFPVVGSAGIVGHHSQKLVVGPGMVVGRKGGAGIVTHVKDDFWPIDTTYFVKLTGKHDVDWLYYLLNFLKLTRLGEGTVPGLNRTDVYHLYIPLPPLPEQRQIADILSEVDAKIETEQAFKSELEQLKKGFMQVLLTGKVRVKV